MMTIPDDTERRVDLLTELRGVQESILLSGEAMTEVALAMQENVSQVAVAMQEDVHQELKKTRVIQLPNLILLGAILIAIVIGLGLIKENREASTLIRDCLNHVHPSCPATTTTTVPLPLPTTIYVPPPEPIPDPIPTTTTPLPPVPDQ